MKSYLTFTLITLLLLIVGSYAQETDTGISVSLSLENKKKVYRLDEPIVLCITIVSKDDRRTIEVEGDSLEARLDDISIYPSKGVFDWRSELKSIMRNYRDAFSFTTLEKNQPHITKINLNRYYRIDKPGNYTVSITTKRIVPKNLAGRGLRLASTQTRVPVKTNTVNFEVLPLSEAEEQEKVEKLSQSLVSSKNPKEVLRLSKELAFMSGDIATREKVKDFVFLSNSSGAYYNLYYGLFMSRNRLLVIDLLEKYWNDIDQKTNHSVLHALTFLHTLEKLKKQNLIDKEAKELQEKANQIKVQISERYVQQLYESLDQRSGKNLTSAAILILNKIRRNQGFQEERHKIQTILIREFDSLDPSTRAWLLNIYGDLFSGPTQIDAIERIYIDSRDAKYGYDARKTAIDKLIELDQKRARPYVIEEIMRTLSTVDPMILAKLDDEFLPEVDECLLQQIEFFASSKNKSRASVFLTLKGHLAARYATRKIYRPLLKIYKQSEYKLGYNAKAALLGYFVRHNEKEGMEMIKKTLSTLNPESGSMLFYDLTKINFPKSLNELFIERLNSEDPEISGSAAYHLTLNKNINNNEVILKRYQRWVDVWAKKQTEMGAENPTPEIRKQIMFQENIVSSLMVQKYWKLNNEQKSKLKKSCMSKDCLRYFPNDL